MTKMSLMPHNLYLSLTLISNLKPLMSLSPDKETKSTTLCLLLYLIKLILENEKEKNQKFEKLNFYIHTNKIQKIYKFLKKNINSSEN